LQQQLSAIFCSVARQRPLLLVIDAVDRADEFSLAVLASLAHEASQWPLMIVWASTQGPTASQHRDTAAALFGIANHLQLPELNRAENASLLESMFGSVPNLSRLADWTYRAAHGNPKLTLALADQMLRRGLVRYVDGTWVLPSDESGAALPQDLDELGAQRLEALGPAALSLAELLSVRRGGASAEFCLATSDLSDSEVFLALEELVRDGVLESAGQDYVFVQDTLRDALQRRLSVERRHELHKRWADALLARAGQDVDHQLEAGWHLVHTADELRGAHLLAQVGPLLVDQGLAMATAIPAIEKALAVYEKHAMPLRVRLRLRSALVLAGYLFDHRLAQRYGDQTLALLHELSGVALAARLQRFLGGKLGFLLGLAFTELRRLCTPASRRGPPIYIALQYFVRSAMGLLGVRALALDAPGTRAIERMLAPLAAAPSFSSGRAAYLACHAFTLQMHGRESDTAAAVQAAQRELRARRRSDISEFEYQNLLIGLALAEGCNECYREASQALAHAERLEQLGTGLARASAERVRMIYYLVRADHERAEQSRRAIELYGIQGGTTWQVEWFAAPAEGMTGWLWTDLVAMRRSLDKLALFAKDMPSLRTDYDGIRIAYHFRRREFARAAELGERFVAEHAPRENIAWGFVYGVTALALIEAGNPERARELCERARAHVSEADMAYFSMYQLLDIAYAVALALLGQRERSDEIWRARFERMRACGEHANLVVMYEHQARMARALGDKALLATAIAAMREAALSSGLPALILLADRTAELRAKLRSSPLPPGTAQLPSQRPPAGPGADTPENAATIFLRRYKTGAERKRQALAMLARWYASEETYLYAVGSPLPQLLAAVPEREAPPQLAEVVSSALSGLSDGATLTHALQVADPQTGQSQSQRFKILPIPGENVGDSALGAVAFRACDDSSEALPEGLLADLARLWGMNGA
jgi:hypothetical protein